MLVIPKARMRRALGTARSWSKTGRGFEDGDNMARISLKAVNGVFSFGSVERYVDALNQVSRTRAMIVKNTVTRPNGEAIKSVSEGEVIVRE